MNNRFITILLSAIVIAGCSRSTGNDLLWLSDGEPSVKAEVVVDPSLDLINDGFIIQGGPRERVIKAKTEIGAIYGKYALQRLEATGKADEPLDIREEPSYERRILNHWDNLDNTVERGYAGWSIWHWGEPVPADRIRDYSRLNASIGINGSVLNNVNATPEMLNGENLRRVAEIADIMRPYGIRSYATPPPTREHQVPVAHPADEAARSSAPPSCQIQKAVVESEIDKVAELCIEAGATDALIVDTDERKSSVWSARGAFLEAIKASTTEMDECDVVVPRNKVAEFVLYTHDVAKELNVRIPSFGHAGDGNLHVYVCRDNLSASEWESTLEKAFDLLYSKARELNGLVSGEHGIGFAKKGFLSEDYGETQLQLMRGIKAAFDPKNILNPDKIF